MTTDRNKAPLVEFAKNCSSLEIRDKHRETMNRSQQRQKEFMMRKTKIKPDGEVGRVEVKREPRLISLQSQRG